MALFLLYNWPKWPVKNLTRRRGRSRSIGATLVARTAGVRLGSWQGVGLGTGNSDQYIVLYNFKSDDLAEKILDLEDYITELENAEETEKQEDILNTEKENIDTIRKYHFNYDNETCIVDRYPEAAATENKNIDEENEISIAPGEGHKPSNILTDKKWDVRAFPMMHPNGKNGLHESRNVKLSDQYYFVQRLRNLDTRFSDEPSYIFAAASYLEKRAMETIINFTLTAL